MLFIFRRERSQLARQRLVPPRVPPRPEIRREAGLQSGPQLLHGEGEALRTVRQLRLRRRQEFHQRRDCRIPSLPRRRGVRHSCH